MDNCNAKDNCQRENRIMRDMNIRIGEFINNLHGYVYMCMCVCMCEREREKEHCQTKSGFRKSARRSYIGISNGV